MGPSEGRSGGINELVSQLIFANSHNTNWQSSLDHHSGYINEFTVYLVSIVRTLSWDHCGTKLKGTLADPSFLRATDLMRKRYVHQINSTIKITIFAI